MNHIFKISQKTRVAVSVLFIQLFVFSQDNVKSTRFNFSSSAGVLFVSPILTAPEIQGAANYSISKKWAINLTLGFVFRSSKNFDFKQVESKRQNNFYFPLYLNGRFKITSRWAITLGLGYSFLNYEDQNTKKLFRIDEYSLAKPGLGYIIPLKVEFKILDIFSVNVGLTYYRVPYYNKEYILSNGKSSFSKIENDNYFSPTFGLNYYFQNGKRNIKK